jgi:glycyl-tRNA synthetase beta chain
MKARLEALDAFSKEPDFEQAVLTFKRAANIIRKQGDEAGQKLTGGYDPDLFEGEHETAFGTRLEETAPRFDDLWEQRDFPGLLGLLRELRPSVDGFFDNVMVMCDDMDVRLNRLNLLKGLVDRLGRLADFNALQV